MCLWQAQFDGQMPKLLNYINMSVMLKGTLLVPVENLQSNCNFMWVGTLNSSNNHVDVIAFKTAKKDDFVSLMKADAESL